MAAILSLLVVAAIATLALSDVIQCNTPDFANARCDCGGTTYDLSKMATEDGSRLECVE